MGSWGDRKYIGCGMDTAKMHATPAAWNYPLYLPAPLQFFSDGFSRHPLPRGHQNFLLIKNSQDFCVVSHNPETETK
jgi:hypothetical protein